MDSMYPNYQDVARRGDMPAETLTAAYVHMSAWRKCVLWVIGGYLLLNNGFEMVRVPPVGGGIPIGEFVLVLCLLGISLPVVLRKISQETWIFPVLVWWGLGLARCLIDARYSGFWAFRDASHAIESLYLIVGFWLVNSVENLTYYLRWLSRILVGLAVYGLTLPFGKSLQAYSPHVPGVSAGSQATLLFSQSGIASLILWAACWMLINRKEGARVFGVRALMASVLVAFTTAFAQSRGVYLQLLMLGAIFLLVRRKVAKKWLTLLALGAVMIGAIPILGINWKGRIGQPISLDFIVQHFGSISGSGDEDVHGAAEGAEMRKRWWGNLYRRIAPSPRHIVFGLGYGMPLTDFHASSGAVVREPHDSYVSILARLGLSGMLAWGLMQVSLYWSWLRSFRLCERMGWTRDRDYLLIMFLYCPLLLVNAIGEDGFEKPFKCIPYYFFFGVILRYGRYLREQAAMETAEQPE